VRHGLYPSQQTANGIVDSADDKLFELVLQSGDRHVLHELLTDRVDISYNLRSRSHDRVLPEKKGHLTDKNFLTRKLYKIKILTNSLIFPLYLVVYYCNHVAYQLRFVNCVLHE